jgi:hypothetical protein
MKFIFPILIVLFAQSLWAEPFQCFLSVRVENAIGLFDDVLIQEMTKAESNEECAGNARELLNFYPPCYEITKEHRWFNKKWITKVNRRVYVEYSEGMFIPTKAGELDYYSDDLLYINRSPTDWSKEKCVPR